ncbi:dolichyl-phosphate-mannose--protein mannosyltransferase [Bailinhaonella thermotolerans]|uniref:Polyprenol-phosphate-mannose--protein mannosyltransferase n=1 Tax=Bailinhaonella thermotolerans TaxID=1070861 RepID=A0A3A4ASL7_9ACTN|nr:phospholipid carrier-dependent glycosyltransferase [Bailinhaonella thermotolerans]RJL31315.1 phospholipid carrier-dependent glycosyltransferase [Bailinhaonella thermotolerans]
MGAGLRFERVWEPREIVFDETYYAKDALSLLRFGVERKTVGTTEDPVADRILNAGGTDLWVQCPPRPEAECLSFVAHPPLGKWMIAAGEWLFGANPLGWRFAVALFGSLTVLILARTALRMTRSTLLGCLAGLLLALDGLHFVLSRTALLDGLVTFWVVAAFACLVVDRDRARERLALALEDVRNPVDGKVRADAVPWLGWRPWRVAGAACLGAAVATKWSGLWFLLAFAVLTLVWDAGARRAAGLRRWGADLPAALPTLALVPAVAYLASWAGWFGSPLGWGRNWDRSSGLAFPLDSLWSWFQYQRDILDFHDGLADGHLYQSWPWSWPVLARPVAFYYPEGVRGCGADDCSRAILAVGTPVIWWGGIAALVAITVWYFRARDWRAAAVLVSYLAGWLPWFFYAARGRTMYLFYALPTLPFLILAIVLAAGWLIGPARAGSTRRTVGAVVAGTFTLLVIVNFWWLHPVLAGEVITYEAWYSRMLFRSWI